MQKVSGDVVCYEVTIDVLRKRAEEFRVWLRAHVSEMLDVNGIQHAVAWEPPCPEPSELRFVVLYLLDSQESLDRYLHEDAPRMRADGMNRFGTSMRAQRRDGAGALWVGGA